MNRHFLPALLLCQLLLQTVYVKAQVTTLEGSSIMFELPGSKWKLALKDHSGSKAIWVYQRESMPGDDAKPTISFMTEEMSVKLRLGQYHIQNMKLAKITETHDFGVGRVIGLVNATLSKGYANADSLYFGVAVNGSKGLTILCTVKGSSFEKYDAEFRSFLGSLGYGSISKRSKVEDKTGTPSQTTATAPNTNSKTAIVSEKDKINACSYFPIAKGMKYHYIRKDMAGDHNIIEQYGMEKDKVIANGKSIKGFKIRTTVTARDRSIIYYYCDNGSMKMLTEMPSYNTHISEYVEDYSLFPSDYNKPDHLKTPIWETEKTGSGIFLNFTELKAGNAGTTWMDVQVVNDNPVIITSKIVATNLSMTVQGKTYSPVLRVDRTVVIRSDGQDMQLNAQEIYYAAGVGKIKVIEKGNDILMGSFTTTQELISYSIPGK